MKRNSPSREHSYYQPVQTLIVLIQWNQQIFIWKIDIICIYTSVYRCFFLNQYVLIILYCFLFFLELKEILTVDGTYKLIYSINGEFPGPAIVVYEGQTVTLLYHFLSQRHPPPQQKLKTKPPVKADISACLTTKSAEQRPTRAIY